MPNMSPEYLTRNNQRVLIPLAVFVNNRFYGWYTRREIREFLPTSRSLHRSLYDQAYLWNPVSQDWWRCDFTPVLTEQVPPIYRTLLLLGLPDPQDPGNP